MGRKHLNPGGVTPFLNVYHSPESWATLNRLSKEWGMNRSAVVRYLLEAQDKEIQPERSVER